MNLRRARDKYFLFYVNALGTSRVFDYLFGTVNTFILLIVSIDKTRETESCIEKH